MRDLVLVGFRLPSWSEIDQKIKEFEKKTAEKISEFESGHPIAAGALSGLFSIFPPPLDAIAQGIFDNADGSDKDKTNAVLGYFKNLQIQGENHYNQMATKLDNILFTMNDVRQITAKESTLQSIQEILISTNKIADKKLDDLKNELEQKMDGLERKIDDQTSIIHKTEQELQKFGLKIEEIQTMMIEIKAGKNGGGKP